MTPSNFIGSEIQLEIFSPNFQTPIIDPVSAIVGDDIEFSTPYPGQSNLIVEATIDLSDNTVAYQISDQVSPGLFSFASGSFNGYVLTDLLGTLPAITNVIIDTSETTIGIDVSDVTFNEDQILVNVEGLPFSVGDTITLDVSFEPVVEDDPNDDDPNDGDDSPDDNESIIIQATPQPDILTGNTLNNRIRALASDDRVQGLSGDDFISGNQGNDVLFGNSGTDTMRGRKGDDDIDGGIGDDRLFGDRGNDFISGGSGDDVIKGNAGRDQLNGGKGNDRLLGNGKQDTINGGAGSDVIVGGYGNDILTGGAGSDEFRYRRIRDRRDIITDFMVGKDVLNFRRMITSYGLDSSNALGTHIILGERSNATVIRFDRDGDRLGNAVTILTLENVAVDDLAEDNFIL